MGFCITRSPEVTSKVNKLLKPEFIFCILLLIAKHFYNQYLSVPSAQARTESASSLAVNVVRGYGLCCL